MSRRVNAAWLQPASTDPTLLVNREKELDDLVHRLEELREAQLHEAHFLITGARGVGKSIFTREALRRFQRFASPLTAAGSATGRFSTASRSTSWRQSSPTRRRASAPSSSSGSISSR